MTELERFFTDLSTDFITGACREVIDRFDLPTAIYVGDDVIVCRTQDRLRAAIERYRGALMRAGIRGVDARATAVPLKRGATGTIWMEILHLDAEGRPVDSSQIRYFFRERFGDPRVCLLEFLRLPNAAAHVMDVYRAA